MKTKHLLISLFGVICLLFACEQAPEQAPEQPNPVITKSVFSGYVQKGPYVNGSSITITLLDENLDQTGSVFSTQIIDNSGNFEQKNMEFASNFIELKADGYYFDEVKGVNSNGSLTLYALADITDINSVNINILTHLERQRIIYLIKENNLNFSVAKKQARSEILDIFKFALPDNVAAESLNIADDDLLLAVSAIVQGHLSTGDLSELLANISSDIRTDGTLDNPVLGSQLMDNVTFLDLDQLVSNMEKKYNGLGITLNVNSEELKSHIEQFKQNCGFEQTLRITYPATGRYGLNILADDCVEVKKMASGGAEYSVKAELPVGKSSLKIVIKSNSPRKFECRNIFNDSFCRSSFSEKHEVCPNCGGVNTIIELGGTEWGVMLSGTNENWLITSWDNNLRGNTFTAFESGISTDLAVMFENDFIIEYYENGATEPTKIKEVKAI